MHVGQQKIDPRRAGLSGLGAISLFLAAVIVLTSTPAVLNGSLHDPAHPISRVGSQLRRIAAGVPVRLTSKAPKRDQHRPIAVLTSAKTLRVSRGARSIRGVESFTGPSVARLAPQFLDLPPPFAAA
jgi:hypothetical protein